MLVLMHFCLENYAGIDYFTRQSGDVGVIPKLHMAGMAPGPMFREGFIALPRDLSEKEVFENAV